MWYSLRPGGAGGSQPTDRSLTLKSLAVPASGTTELSFATQYDLADNSGFVEVSADAGSTWTALTGTVGGAAKATLETQSSGWVSASYDLSAHAGQTIRVRFRLHAPPGSGGGSTGGWGIDNVAVSNTTSGAVFCDDMEAPTADWLRTSSNGVQWILASYGQ